MGSRRRGMVWEQVGIGNGCVDWIEKVIGGNLNKSNGVDIL